jgi:hypothetical protein
VLLDVTHKSGWLMTCGLLFEKNVFHISTKSLAEGDFHVRIQFGPVIITMQINIYDYRFCANSGVKMLNISLHNLRCF